MALNSIREIIKNKASWTEYSRLLKMKGYSVFKEEGEV